ncbi:MAG: hypothetical protein WD691_11415 [Acidimicrobiales bacterium]
MRDGSNPPPDVDRVIDLDRAARPGDPPVAGAQWDEVRRVWEHWDEAAQGWVIAGDTSGEALPPATMPQDVREPDAWGSSRPAVPVPEDPDVPHIIDVDRLAEPAVAVPGAQWNEVVGRWEHWDESAGAWVDATV